LFTSYTGKVSLVSKFFFPSWSALHAHRTKDLQWVYSLTLNLEPVIQLLELVFVNV
jgi:hypothetical protein